MARFVLGILVLGGAPFLVLHPWVHDCHPVFEANGIYRECTETTYVWRGGFIVGAILTFAGAQSIIRTGLARRRPRWTETAVAGLIPSLAHEM
jgi:hypothetical protein